jgi:branched-chain amino acid transport system ATP-binding protein
MLTISDLVVERGTIAVLDGVSLAVPASCLLGVFGQNGAGKSTLLAAVCGLVPVRRGQIVFDNRAVEGLSPQRLLRAGISLVPQGRHVFPGLTVRQNLEIGGLRVGDRRTLTARVEEYLGRHPGLARRAEIEAGRLSGGEQGLCVLGRALMAEPSVLLLDEPLMGLAPATGETVLTELRAIADSGRSVVVVEHNRAAVARYADHTVEVADGQVRPWS